MIMLGEKLINMTSLINVLIKIPPTVLKTGFGTNPQFFLPDVRSNFSSNSIDRTHVLGLEYLV